MLNMTCFDYELNKEITLQLYSSSQLKKEYDDGKTWIRFKNKGKHKVSKIINKTFIGDDYTRHIEIIYSNVLWTISQKYIKQNKDFNLSLLLKKEFEKYVREFNKFRKVIDEEWYK
jgi:hypothetical protein